jgi:hypothetical protein
MSGLFFFVGRGRLVKARNSATGILPVIHGQDGRDTNKAKFAAFM